MCTVTSVFTDHIEIYRIQVVVVYTGRLVYVLLLKKEDIIVNILCSEAQVFHASAHASLDKNQSQRATAV